jgi:ABC-type Fe3+-siderophore transport system permease subunit
MAYKSLFVNKYLAFHEKAAAIEWPQIDKRLQYVILALIKISGLGFLVTALLLLIFPIVNYFVQDEFVRYSIPVLAFIFCSGLFIINYSLYKQSKSITPWKGSLFAMIAIIAGVILSALQ